LEKDWRENSEFEGANDKRRRIGAKSRRRHHHHHHPINQGEFPFFCDIDFYYICSKYLHTTQNMQCMIIIS
jgi:hypothetical protein